jgi:hypothetical protein
MTHRIPAVPTVLDDVRGQFERWREAHPPRTRIPEALWSRAVSLAREHGVYRVARELHLRYYSLKERVESAGGHDSGLQMAAAGFVELVAKAKQNTAAIECTVELERRGGERMRIHLRGAETADLVALSRTLWENRG